VTRGLPGDPEDEQARFIEGVFSTPSGALRVASLYLPNGNPVDDEKKFPYKLSWMGRLENWATDRLALEEPLVLAGDYNVIPEPADARFPENWVNDALFQPQTRQAFRRLANLGFADAVRSVTDQQTFTFWDYQAGAWQKNNGIRIDHLMLSPEAADRLASASIEKHVRAWEKPSDHVPVAIELR
jgi:exodeoxyribonuclease-3